MRPTTVLGACVAVAALGGIARGVWNATTRDAADGASPSGEGADAAAPRDGRASLAVPSGSPPSITCDTARRIVAQARAQLASAPPEVDPRALADATADWLDPHGLWSAAPDAPVVEVLRRRASDARRELEAPPGSGPCTFADEAGASVEAWVSTLRSTFDAARAEVRAPSPVAAWEAAAGTAFEEGDVTVAARSLAALLGRRAADAVAGLGPELAPFAEAARARVVPDLDRAGWADAVVAASVRAYVPLVDPHGAWAPRGEESSLDDPALDDAAAFHLWGRMVRAPLGLRVGEQPLAPIVAGDLVLEIDGVATAGLPVEQAEQLGAPPDGDGSALRRVLVWREGEAHPRMLDVAPPPDEPAAPHGEQVSTARVPYGDGSALVVSITDVPDDLGELLGAVLSEARATEPPAGIVLDLRGNGGGSTDGAAAAIGLFLPGAPLFPMHRRDGRVETDRAPEPEAASRWSGPLAVLVDAETASAAEMIAGGLASYHRAVLAGGRTYGKGCAQEYLDDDAQAGVLRLTTLLFALPDGAPVQRVGLVPTLHLGLAAGDEREATLAHAPPTWRGPDVRDPARVAEVPWLPHRGRVGPCDDDVPCRALRALGSPRAPVARGAR